MLLWGQKIFNAAQIPGLSAWYDFTNSAYLTLSATAITQALDRSGSGNNTDVQGTGTARPTFTSSQINGLSAAVFDGGDTLVLPAALYSIPNGANTIFSVAVSTDNTSQRRIVTMTDGGTARYKLGVGTKAGVASATTSTFGNFATGSVGADYTTGTNTNYQIYTGQRSGTTQTMSINNNTAVSDSNAASFTATTAYIGSQAGSAVFWIGTICEILIYNRALTAAEIVQVNRYLSQKYAITIA